MTAKATKLVFAAVASALHGMGGAAVAQRRSAGSGLIVAPSGRSWPQSGRPPRGWRKLAARRRWVEMARRRADNRRARR